MIKQFIHVNKCLPTNGLLSRFIQKSEDENVEQHAIEKFLVYVDSTGNNH